MFRDGNKSLIKGIARYNTEVKTDEDLIGPGAAPGTTPTDLEQATGLERLEILGKMEGVDVFNMRPLDSSRTGKLERIQLLPPRKLVS